MERQSETFLCGLGGFIEKLVEKRECLVSYRANGKTASRCLQWPSVPPMRKMGQKGEQLNLEAKLVVGGFLQRGLGRKEGSQLEEL